MIHIDWSNMTQAVWRSPLLPLLSESPLPEGNPAGASNASPRFGTGAKFKLDLLAYLHKYGNQRTGELTRQVQQYDFSDVRAALVASVPGRHSMMSENETQWGWPGLKAVLKEIPTSKLHGSGKAHIVSQVSISTSEAIFKRRLIAKDVINCISRANRCIPKKYIPCNSGIKFRN